MTNGGPTAAQRAAGRRVIGAFDPESKENLGAEPSSIPGHGLDGAAADRYLKTSWSFEPAGLHATLNKLLKGRVFETRRWHIGSPGFLFGGCARSRRPRRNERSRCRSKFRTIFPPVRRSKRKASW